MLTLRRSSALVPLISTPNLLLPVVAAVALDKPLVALPPHRPPSVNRGTRADRGRCLPITSCRKVASACFRVGTRASARACANPSVRCTRSRGGSAVRAEARARGRRGAGPWDVRIREGPRASRCCPAPRVQQALPCASTAGSRAPTSTHPGALPQAVPAISFPRSQRDKQSKVFISKLHSKGTGESVSGALCGVRTRGSDATLAPRALIWLSEQGDRRSLIAAATFLLGCSKMSALSVGEGHAARIRASRECDAARVLAPARLRPSHTRSAHAPCCPPLDLCRGVAVLTQNRFFTHACDRQRAI